MKRLHIFILRSFFGPLILTFFIVLFLLLMQFLWKYIDDLVGKGLETHVLLELLSYTTISLIPMALPLAVLLASIMTFGNLGENYELLALKSAGISLQRIMFPLIVVIICISISAFFFSNNILPYTNLKMRSLLFDIQRQRPELQIKEGVFYNGIDGYSIKIGKRENKSNLLRDIKIYDHTARRGNTSVTIADSGYMKMSADENNLIITLYSGYNYAEVFKDKRRYRKERTYPFRRDKFDEQIIILKLSGFGLNRTDESLFKNDYHMMNLKQLKNNKDSLLKQYQIFKQQFKTTITKSGYMRFENQLLKKINDSTSYKEIVKEYDTVNVDTLFAHLSEREKQNTVTRALNLVRSTKNNISSHKNFDYTKVKRIRRHEIEWHRKFTLSFACFIFFFIGAPLGAIIRKGGLGMPVVISVLFFVLYYVISLTGEKFVREDMIKAYEGMWISSIILLPLGIFLTYKATTDSVILNIDTYLNIFKKLFVINKRNPQN